MDSPDDWNYDIHSDLVGDVADALDRQWDARDRINGGDRSLAALDDRCQANADLHNARAAVREYEQKEADAVAAVEAESPPAAPPQFDAKRRRLAGQVEFAHDDLSLATDQTAGYDTEAAAGRREQAARGVTAAESALARYDDEVRLGLRRIEWTPVREYDPWNDHSDDDFIDNMWQAAENRRRMEADCIDADALER